jgi:cytochrome c oxidase subunit 2
MQKRSSSSLKWILNLALLSAAPIAVTPSVHAQTRESLHAQNPNQENDQVHAFGSAEQDKRPFAEKYAAPKSISSFGHIFDETFWHVSYEGIFCFVIITLVLLIAIFFFRHKPGKRAAYFDGTSRTAVFASIGFGFLVFLVLDFPLIRSSYDQTFNVMWNYPKGPDVIKIMVMPQQWAWNFKYPGNDGLFNTDDDIDTVNEMRIPVNKKVMLQIKAKDVIHGFMFPNVRYQVDAIPGHVTQFWFDTLETGDFELACYHICGTSHYKMKGFIKVLNEDDFNSWAKENSEWAKAKYDADDRQIRWGWNWGMEETVTQNQVTPQIQLKAASKTASVHSLNKTQK